MKGKLERALDFVLGRRQHYIHRRLTRLVLFSSLLSFLVLGAATLYGMVSIQRTFELRGHDLGEAVGDFTAVMSTDNSVEQIRDMVLVKSRHIDSELNSILQNTRTLSEQMTHIGQHPEMYLPHPLPDPRLQTVAVGMPYVFYCNKVMPSMTEAVRHEMDMDGNIGVAMEAAGRAYPDYMYLCYVGSERGYTFRLDRRGERGDHLTFAVDFWQQYDPRQRRWYELARASAKPVFTDIYLGTNGKPCITCTMPYRDAQGKFAGAVAIDSDLNTLATEIKDDVISQNSFNFAINGKGQLVFSSRETGTLSIEQIGRDIRSAVGAMEREWFTENTSLLSGEKREFDAVIAAMIGGERGILPVSIDGEDYVLAFEPLKATKCSFGMALSRKDVIAPALVSRQDILDKVKDFIFVLHRLFVFIFAVAAIMVCFLLYSVFNVSNKISDRFAVPFRKLSDGVREIAEGNLDRKIVLHTGDELEELAKAFNAMSADLKDYTENLTRVAAEQEHIATQLSVAKEIQMSNLPREFPAAAEFGLYATMRTAKEVGGDFYDFYFLDKNHLAITIADVSGKGVGAALFMLVTKTVLQNFALTSLGAEDLARVMRCTNDRLAQNNDAMMFVTTFLGILNLKTGKFAFVNGGHNPPLMYRAAAQSYEYLSVQKNFVLGPMDNLDFKQQELIMNPGDRLFLYTDGVTEALNPEKELYGEERLQETLNRRENHTLGDQELLAAVQESLADYVQDAEQSDDITMMSLTYRGRGA